MSICVSRGGKDPVTVSSKKDRLIEDAQRFALRGQLDKAIKAYEQVITLDPSAINQRQRLAELLVKAGRIDGARSEFEAIGRYFSSNGYYLKAIAVYKKLQVMFPDDITISLFLADLNEKHGLVANALVEYKQVYDYYERNADSEEALKILEKMHLVDQKNIAIKLKLAEAYFQADRKDESYSLFGRLALLLQERGDYAGLDKLHARIQQLFSGKSEFMLEVLTEQVRGDTPGALQNAVGSLQSLLRTNPENKKVWDLIIEAYQRLDQPERVKLAYQHCIKFFPNDLSVQKGLIECLIADRDLDGTLKQLDVYERHFVESSAFADLLSIYQALDKVAPINLRVLQGLKRAYESMGDGENVAAIDHKIQSLQSFSEKRPSQPDTPMDEFDLGRFEESLPEVELSQPVEWEGPESREEFSAAEESDVAAFLEPEEIEIEIELDEGDASPFASLPQEDTMDGTSGDAWLESVDDVFDSAAAARSVKFGDDVDISDAQTHYDLGVAFKEMGLLDEAISEFRQASEDESRRVACLVLQGACLREKGNLDTAEGLLRSLMNPGLGIEDVCSIKYELALVCQDAGKSEEAAGLLAEISAANPGFRDVSARLGSSGDELPLDFSDEELKGFDLK